MTRSQLADLGLSPDAIRHRLARGRIHRILPGIYAVGRPDISERGRWMAAVLACGPRTLLSHRYFLPLALKAGLPLPETQAQLGSHRVDFFWPELGLVVETDSLRYHRTAFKQAADKRRDNAHARSGLVTLRFTHGHVRYEPDYVRSELRAVIRLLTKASS